LASFFPVEAIAAMIETLPAPPSIPAAPKRPQAVALAWNPPVGASYDVPITIGRAR
jgi:hypothetical protein